ncbi:MAG: hypothetical protein ACE5IL_04395 [Myxococcota bacterium]
MTLERILTVVLLAHAPALSAQPERAGSEEPAPRSSSESPPESGWARVRHPTLPVTLDLPDGASYRQVRSFPLGSPRGRGGRRWEFTLFGVRSLDEAGVRYHALEVALFRIGASTRGIEAAELARLSAHIRDPVAVESLLRRVLYASSPAVHLRDLGLEFVDGLAARRFEVDRIVARGTAAERPIEGEVVLIPLDRSSAMIVSARFDPKATPRERKVLFLRILRSIRLDAHPGGDLQAARTPAGPRRLAF